MCARAAQGAGGIRTWRYGTGRGLPRPPPSRTGRRRPPRDRLSRRRPRLASIAARPSAPLHLPVAPHLGPQPGVGLGDDAAGSRAAACGSCRGAARAAPRRRARRAPRSRARRRGRSRGTGTPAASSSISEKTCPTPASASQSPTPRSPGVSIRTPPPGRTSRLRVVVVCRPLPSTSRVACTSMTSAPSRALARVDLPAPDWPSSTAVPPDRPRASTSSPSPVAALTARTCTPGAAASTSWTRCPSGRGVRHEVGLGQDDDGLRRRTPRPARGTARPGRGRVRRRATRRSTAWSTLAARIWPSDRLEEVERTKAVRRGSSARTYRGSRSSGSTATQSPVHTTFIGSRGDDERGVGAHHALGGDDVALAAVDPDDTAGQQALPGERGELARPGVVPAVRGQGRLRGRRARETKRKTRGDPSQGRPRRAHSGANEEGRSAGDHGGGLDELLDAGSARHNDSHRSSPPGTRLCVRWPWTTAGTVRRLAQARAAAPGIYRPRAHPPDTGRQP